VNAFDLLQSEGYTRGAVGSGTYVSGTLPDHLLEVTGPQRAPGGESRVRTPRAPGGESRVRTPRWSQYARRVKAWSGTQVRPSRAFRANVPAIDLFPTTLWAQISARRLRRAP
jgi:GntR family transcriptional regulator / MocR family aminotransferase